MKHFFFKTLQVAEFFIAMQQPKLKKKQFSFIFFFEILSRPHLCSSFAHLKNYRANIFETKKRHSHLPKVS